MAETPGICAELAIEVSGPARSRESGAPSKLSILIRKLPKRLRLTNSDRLLLVWLYRLFLSILSVIRIVRPETLILWHRRGFQAYWRWKSRPGVGRPPIDGKIRDLIRQMSVANPLWGAPRVHGELLMLGSGVVQPTVAKYMVPVRIKTSVIPSAKPAG